MGQRLAVEAGPEPFAALDGVAQKASPCTGTLRSVFVPDPPAQVPILPVYLQVRL